jgi:predicted RND superfamily exporter protein
VPGEAKISGGLAALSRLTERFPWPIGLTSLLVVAFAGWGFTRLVVETDFSKNFRSESEIVQGISYFEDNLGGVGTWDVSFDAPATLDFEFIDKVRGLAADLRSLKLEDGTALTKVVAISDGVDLVPIPGSVETKIAYLNRLQPEFVSSLYNPDPHEQPGEAPAKPRMRLVLRGLERQPAEVKLRLIAEVEEITRQHFPDADAEAAGLYVLLANLITSLLGDQLVSFGISGIGICITMAIAFRSLRIGLISIVPNAFPIALLIGSLGWMGIPINIGTAMIASVSMGLTVDSSIHYLTAYRACRRQGASHAEAIQQAHGTVGFVLVLANIALVAGFSVLATSHFIPLVYFGILVSLAMVGGLIGNLVLLPLLLKIARL